MNPQSIELQRPKFLPRYGDDAMFFLKGKRYVFSKKENAEEPSVNSRALRTFDNLGDALEWSRKNLGPDLFLIVST